VSYLAARIIPWLWPYFFVHAHEERLLFAYTALGIPRFCGAEPSKRRLEEASPHT
jgi:hypothetical protein